MNINSVESLERTIQNEETPELDKEKVINYLANYKEEDKKRGKPKYILATIFICAILVSGVVFGEEIVNHIKKTFQIRDKSGEIQYEYSLMEEPKHVALLPKLLSEKELNAIWEYWNKVAKTIEPGSIAYFIDLDTYEKTDMIIGVSRFKEYHSFKDLKNATEKMNYKSFGEEMYGYKFIEGSVLYKVDKKALKSKSRDEFVEMLIKKAKKEGSRFAYEACEMTDEVEIVNLSYSDLEGRKYKFMIQNLDDLGHKEESSKFDPSKIKELKAGSIDVILEFEPHSVARFVMDGNRYCLFTTGTSVTEEDIVKIVELLDSLPK